MFKATFHFILLFLSLYLIPSYTATGDNDEPLFDKLRQLHSSQKLALKEYEEKLEKLQKLVEQKCESIRFTCKCKSQHVIHNSYAKKENKSNGSHSAWAELHHSPPGYSPPQNEGLSWSFQPPLSSGHNYPSKNFVSFSKPPASKQYSTPPVPIIDPWLRPSITKENYSSTYSMSLEKPTRPKHPGTPDFVLPWLSQSNSDSNYSDDHHYGDSKYYEHSEGSSLSNAYNSNYSEDHYDLKTSEENSASIYSDEQYYDDSSFSESSEDNSDDKNQSSDSNHSNYSDDDDSDDIDSDYSESSEESSVSKGHPGNSEESSYSDDHDYGESDYQENSEDRSVSSISVSNYSDEQNNDDSSYSENSDKSSVSEDLSDNSDSSYLDDEDDDDSDYSESSEESSVSRDQSDNSDSNYSDDSRYFESSEESSVSEDDLYNSDSSYYSDEQGDDDSDYPESSEESSVSKDHSDNSDSSYSENSDYADSDYSESSEESSFSNDHPDNSNLSQPNYFSQSHKTNYPSQYNPINHSSSSYPANSKRPSDYKETPVSPFSEFSQNYPSQTLNSYNPSKPKNPTGQLEQQIIHSLPSYSVNSKEPSDYKNIPVSPHSELSQNYPPQTLDYYNPSKPKNPNKQLEQQIIYSSSSYSFNSKKPSNYKETPVSSFSEFSQNYPSQTLDYYNPSKSKNPIEQLEQQIKHSLSSYRVNSKRPSDYKETPVSPFSGFSQIYPSQTVNYYNPLKPKNPNEQLEQQIINSLPNYPINVNSKGPSDYIGTPLSPYSGFPKVYSSQTLDYYYLSKPKNPNEQLQSASSYPVNSKKTSDFKETPVSPYSGFLQNYPSQTLDYYNPSKSKNLNVQLEQQIIHSLSSYPVNSKRPSDYKEIPVSPYSEFSQNYPSQTLDYYKPSNAKNPNKQSEQQIIPASSSYPAHSKEPFDYKKNPENHPSSGFSQNYPSQTSDYDNTSKPKNPNEQLEKHIIQSPEPKRNLPRNCKEVQNKGQNCSGFYFIKPEAAPHSFLVWCDMVTMGGGWTTVMHRFDDSEDFRQSWEEYKHGFGPVNGEFWLGLDFLHYLTKEHPNELLVVVGSGYAHYKTFRIGCAKKGFVLQELSGYTGNTENLLSKSLGMKFSTFDKDHTNGCVKLYDNKGWWFPICHEQVSRGELIQPLTEISTEHSRINNVKIMVRPTNLPLVPSTPPLPKTCKEAKNGDNAKSGLVLIQPHQAPKSFYVYCDMERLGGGWIIFLNRVDKSQSFAKNLEAYKRGFGNFKKSYWLGLDNLYYLTKKGSELLVVLHDWKGRELYAHYKNFKIGSEKESYPILELSGYSGTAENSLEASIGKKFSTNDRDYSKGCSVAYGGRGWWFTDCHQMHFTRKHEEKSDGNRWLSKEGSFQDAVMMVRPAN